MAYNHHLLYIPGIKDDLYKVQSLAMLGWRLYGLSGHCYPMPWASDEAYETKFNRLLAAIDHHRSKGHQVSLMGASAGASAVLNAYAKRKDAISSVTLICGKINDPKSVSKQTYESNPGFSTSLRELQKNIKNFTAADTAKFRSYISRTDTVVPYAATTYPGIEERRLPDLRHGQAIVYSLTFGAAPIAAHIRSIK